MTLGGLQFDQQQRISPRRSSGNVLAALVAIALLLGGVVFGAKYLVSGFGGASDYPGPGTGTATVVVRTGDTTSLIADHLVAAKIVLTTDAFIAVAAADARSTSIQPGTYTLQQEMAAADALDALLNPANRTANSLTIPEGWRNTQIATALAKVLKVPVGEVTQAMVDPTLALPAAAAGNPEGYLFPARYDFPPGTTPSQALAEMVQRWGQAASDVNLTTGAAKLKITPNQALIVASLVQAEGIPADYPKVARVIYNRLAKGIALQLDSTVNYALGRSNIVVTNTDIATDSAYNTYKNKGLPPGPINNPGEAALQAALSPTAGGFLYFVTTNPKTGVTKFTSSYQEFLGFKKEFEAYLGSTATASSTR